MLMADAFDRQELLDELDGDVDFLRESMEMLGQDAPGLLANIRDALKHELAVARELSDAEHRKHEEALLGESIPVRALREGIAQQAAIDEPLLLTGPAGAGQEAVARAIHRNSPRRDRPFIYVACPHIAGADETLLGVHSGMGADGRIGKVALADGGTIYLERVETLMFAAL
jgi:two-component system C4-dicarboxylate transport response regulator DctD